MTTTKYPLLFSPLRVRSIMFPNRIFLSPQNHSPRHRHPSSYDSLYDAGMMFFDKSQGGFGGCSLMCGPIMPDGTIEKYSRDQLRELMSMAVQTGAKVGAGVSPFVFKLPVQGEKAKLELKPHYVEIEGGTPKGAPQEGGDIPLMDNYRASDGMWDGYPCKEMPKEIIEKSIVEVRTAAKAAKQFGFDYIEVNGFAHGGAILSFLSAKENHRTDEYGGDIDGRCKYPLDVLKAVREEVGTDMPIMITISSHFMIREVKIFPTRKMR